MTTPEGTADTSERIRTDASGLDRSLAGGILWSAGAKWSTQVVAWGATLIVANVLGPQAFGLLGLATLYLGFVNLFVQLGLGSAIVALRGLDEEQIAQLNTIAALLGVASFILTGLLATPIALFFRSPELPSFLGVMSLSLVIASFRIVPAALLQKDMRFKRLAAIDATQAVGQSLTTVGFALTGFGHWALAAGVVAGSLIATLLTVAARTHRFSRPRRRDIERPIRFGADLLASGLGWFAHQNADFVVAGRMLGEVALGAYTMAWNLASVPLEKVTNLVTSVTPPVFSAVQNDPAMLRRYLVRLTEVLALVTFPATLGVALVAADLIDLALGPKWYGAIAPLQLLAVYASLRSIVTLLPQVVTVLGDTRFLVRMTMFSLLILPPAFYLGSFYGTAGIASGWVLVYPVIPFLMYRRVFRAIEMPVREYLAGLRPAIDGCLAMALAVALVKYALPETLGPAARLMCQVPAGAAAYWLALVLVHRDRLHAFREFAAFIRR